MGNNVKKKTHTIPRSYLENFTDIKANVWVLDTTNKIFNTSPYNVLTSNYFYRITLKNGEKSMVVEDTLANMEGEYINIFREKISNDKFLTDEERAKVSVFISGMLHRTKPRRESMRRTLEKLKVTMMEWQAQCKNDLETLKNLSAMPSSGKGISLEELEIGLASFNEHYADSLIPWIVSTAQFIFDMKWSIWKYPNTEGGFVTSDSPLVILRPSSIKKYGRNAIGSQPGLAYRDAEITLPLSKDRLLLAGWILNEDSYTYVPKEIAENINQRTILNSSERIIAHSQKQLEDIRAKYPPHSATL